MALEEYKGVFIFAQQVDNEISNIAFELLGKGKDLAADLGTEVTTPVVQSGLYTLVDSRITSCKRTILCTTLYSDEIGIRYSSSVCSRLDGYYKTIHFAGTDIRQLQKRG